jgi:hypothetical protein
MDDTGKCVADTTGVPDAYKYFQDLQTAGAKWYDKYDDLASDFKAGKIDLIATARGPRAATRTRSKTTSPSPRCRPARRAIRSR